MSAKNNKTLNLLFGIHIFNDGYSASLILLLPFIASDLGISLAEVGLIGTMLKVMGIFLALPAGYIASRFGAIRVLIISVLIYSIGYLGTGFAHNIWQILIFFFVAGLSFGIFHPIAFATIASLSEKNSRGKAIGGFSAIGEIGRIGSSSLITIIASSIGWRLTSLSYGLLAFIAFITFLLIFRNLNRDKLIIEQKEEQKVNFKDFLKIPSFLYINIANFIDVFASSSLFLFLPFLLLSKGIEPALLGSFAAAMFIGSFLGKSVLGRLSDKYGGDKVVIYSEIIMAISIFLLVIVTSQFYIVIISLLLGAVTRGTTPVMKTLISESVDPNSYQKAFSLNGFTNSIAGTISSLSLGIIADQFGIDYAFCSMAILALLVLIPIIMFMIFKKNEGGAHNGI